MASNIYMRTVDVTTSYAALESARTVASVTISCPPGNAGNVTFKGDDGSDVPWIPGEYHSFRDIDLSQIEIKGTSGDTVTIVGEAG